MTDASDSPDHAPDVAIDAMLALRGRGQLPVGRERIAMLEAVAEHGSITAAARAVGYSYKAVWDGLNAVNNLLPRPALIAQTGGRGGGGAVLTEDGRRLIAAFRRLEQKLSRISAALADDTDEMRTDLLFWSVAMKTSARNTFHCQVVEVRQAPVNVEVTLRLTDTATMTAVITNHSVAELGLAPGRDVVALVKSSFVFLATGEQAPRTTVRNCMHCTVEQRVDGGVNTEFVLSIGGGKTLVSVVTKHSADLLGLGVGDPVWAMFDAAHVILAAD